MTLTPTEEMGKRFGEVVPGLKAAAGAVGLESHRQMLHDYAARVRSDYKFQQSLLGNTIEDDDKPEEEMGDIIITGDLNFGGSTSPEQAISALKSKVATVTSKGTAAAPAAPTDTPATPAAPTEPVASAGGASVSAGIPTWLKVGLTIAALGASGGTGAIIASLLTSAPQVIQQVKDTDTDTNSALRFKKEGE